LVTYQIMQIRRVPILGFDQANRAFWIVFEQSYLILRLRRINQACTAIQVEPLTCQRVDTSSGRHVVVTGPLP
jgi:hypothetical protein